MQRIGGFVLHCAYVVIVSWPVGMCLAQPTQRDASGLALSSRNGYLDEGQRETATVISRALQDVTAMLEDGNRDFAALEKVAAETIAAAGMEVDYVAIRDAVNLREPRDGVMHLVALAAARINGVRLLDNELVELID